MLSINIFFEDVLKKNINISSPDSEWNRLQMKKIQETIPNNETAMIVYSSQPEMQKNIDLPARVNSYEQMYHAATL